MEKMAAMPSDLLSLFADKTDQKQKKEKKRKEDEKKKHKDKADKKEHKSKKPIEKEKPHLHASTIRQTRAATEISG